VRTPQRVRRHFHRLVIFLAGIPLLVGVAWSVLGALSAVNRTVTGDVNVHDAYRTTFFPALEDGLSLTLAATLAVYLFVRAIGWVVSRFASKRTMSSYSWTRLTSPH
jgi:hypothetical protein